MAKKTFGLPVGIPLEEIIREGEMEVGSLVIEVLPLSQIEPDPENPRALRLNPQALRTLDPTDPLYERKRAALQGIEELAVSIQRVGVQQPIKVYRHGKGYRIAFGERRYLASILAGLKAIPAWILPTRPAFMHSLQFAENEQRSRLGAWERIYNIRLIIQEFESYGEERIDSAAVLAQVTGLGLSMANNYFDLVNGPEEVLHAVRDQVLTNVELAAFIAREPDTEKRRLALAAAQAGATGSKVHNALKGKSRTAAGRGRPATQINLGKIASTVIVRTIIERVLGEQWGNTLGEIDWEDCSSVTAAWQKLLHHLEQENRL